MRPIAGLVFLLASLPACAAPPAADWPTLLGPAGDGVSAETGIRTRWPADGLKKLWDVSLGSGYAPPTVAAGKLYHFDQVEGNARLTCRDAATGAPVWTHDTPTTYDDAFGYDPGPRAAPVVAGGRVFTHGVDGVVTAVDAATGKKLWAIDTRKVYHVHPNFFGVGSVPLVVGDRVIVAVGGSPKGPKPDDFKEIKGNGTALVAFDAATGTQAWAAGDDLASYSSPVLRPLGGKPTILYFGRGGLTGVDPAAGTERFFAPYRSKLTESVNAANPVVVGDEVLLSECYENGATLFRFAAGKLTVVWSDAGKDRGDKSLQSHWCTPIADGRYVYGCHGRNANDAELRCLDRTTGEVKWAERRTTRCTLVKIDSYLLSFGEQAQLRLIKLNPDKYDEVARWQVPGLGYPTWAPPTISGGRLYLRGKDPDDARKQRLACYELIPAK